MCCHTRSHARALTLTHLKSLTCTSFFTSSHALPRSPSRGQLPSQAVGGRGLCSLPSSALSPEPRTLLASAGSLTARTRPLPRGPGPGLGGLDSAEHGQGTQALTAGRLSEPAASPAGLGGSPDRQHQRIRLARAPANRASPGPTWTVESELRGGGAQKPASELPVWGALMQTEVGEPLNRKTAKIPTRE